MYCFPHETSADSDRRLEIQADATKTEKKKNLLPTFRTEEENTLLEEAFFEHVSGLSLKILAKC